jgi:hypothetical protein
MPVYLVGFDVRNGSAVDDRKDLQKAFGKLETHRLMPCLYLVSSPFTPSGLKDYLLSHMSAKDCVWVSKLHPRAKLEFAYQTAGGTSTWLKKHGRVEVPKEPPPAPSAAPGNTIYQRPDLPRINGHSNGAVVVHA